MAGPGGTQYAGRGRPHEGIPLDRGYWAEYPIAACGSRSDRFPCRGDDGQWSPTRNRPEAADRRTHRRQAVHDARIHCRNEKTMSRPSKGARLWLRPERRTKAGKLKERSAWVIRDGEKYVGTGCPPAQIAAAEEKLREYLATKYAPVRKERDIEKIAVADVLSIYVDDRRDGQQNKK